jgi:arginine decarboxylase
LVGAYQEILGDMHNLFGDPNIVHVDLDEAGRARISHVVRGDRTQEVLSYVEYFEPDLIARMRRHIERSLQEGRMSLEESALLQRRYEAGLASYTYLAREQDPIEAPLPVTMITPQAEVAPIPQPQPQPT